MNNGLSMLLAGFAVIGAGCSNLDRSRDLANPNVPAAVTAAQVCSTCHGPNGNSESPAFPRLAGQQATYIVNQLTNFRSHQRSDPPGVEFMWGISRYLTDGQIAGLAEFFSKQKPLRSGAPFDPALVAKGKEIYNQGIPGSDVIPCMACHGPTGQGMEAFPRLAYQHADYIVKQLDVFQSTQERPGTPMESITHPLTGEHKEAIAAYLQAFPD
jgi:cytochrome c553